MKHTTVNEKAGMTKIYFVRHAQPDYSNHDDMLRPLTDKGWADSKKVTQCLGDKGITRAFSSPYKRSMDTIKDFTDYRGLVIDTIVNFRERKISDGWIEDFHGFAKKQWHDFDYKLTNGESLNEVQERNIRALTELLESNDGENIVVGTHGTALSTIINFYDNDFGYDQFDRIRPIMPYIICFRFQGTKLIDMEEIEV